MRALIVGGGVAGPVTAMALQQAGIESTIFESHPRIDGEVGSYFTVSPNGLDALDAVGALPLATAVGFSTRRNFLWNHAGRLLGTVPLGAPLPDGTVAQTMKRARLTRLLQDEAIRRGIPFEWGRRLTDALVTADGRVVAAFADGAQASGDLLVGADGVHSATRHIIDRSAPTGRYVGLTNFGGVTRGVALDAEPEAWHLIFGRDAFFGYHATPAGDAVWFANVPRDAIGSSERASTTDAAWKDHLIERFARDRGPAVELISAGELELAGDNTYDLGHVPTWHRGPRIVIGDAAHAPAPTSGQGASMAMEDGVVLAKALRDLPKIEGALVAYEKLRRERVEKIVAFGARASGNKTPGALGRIARDFMMRVLFPYIVNDKALAWLYDYRVEWDRRIPVASAARTAAPIRSGESGPSPTR